MESTIIRLSPHFTLAEFTASATADRLDIDNSMPELLLPAARLLAVHVLEPVRERFGTTRLNSGYRCLELNRAVGSSDGSQHRLGEAADLRVPGVENRLVAEFIRDECQFDQLILENVRPGVPGSGWVHVSYRAGRLRHQVLTKVVGERGYRQGLVA